MQQRQGTVKFVPCVAWRTIEPIIIRKRLMLDLLTDSNNGRTVINNGTVLRIRLKVERKAKRRIKVIVRLMVRPTQKPKVKEGVMI